MEEKAKNYVLLNEIASGGQGTVYKGMDKTLGRVVAIKEFKKAAHITTKELMDSLTDIKSCFHPALPLIFDIYIHRGSVYMVMEYIKGKTLLEYVEEEGSLTPLEAIRITERIGDLLSYLHSHNGGMIYSDLKPENVIIDTEGNVRLIDTGSIVSIKRYNNTPKKPGFYATFGFSSPEQSNAKAISTRSDIYSLGAILHFMLSGVNPAMPPYLRKNLKEYNKGFPNYIVKAVTRSLEHDPNKRFPTVEAMLSELKNPRRNYIPIIPGFGSTYKQEKMIFVSSGKRLGALICLTLALIAGILASSGALTSKANQSPYEKAGVYELEVTDQSGNHLKVGKLTR